MNKRILFFGIIAFSSVLLNSVLAYIIFSLSSSDKFEPAPMFFQDYNNSSDSISFTDYNNISAIERDYLTSRLITQYIVDRYTFIPDQNYFDSKMGIWYAKKVRGSVNLNDPKYTISLLNTFDKKKQNQIWENYVDTKFGMYPIFNEMLKKNTSQQVEIISAPHKERNYWTSTIRLHKTELGQRETTITKKLYLQGELQNTFPMVLETRPELYFYFLVTDFKEE